MSEPSALWKAYLEHVRIGYSMDETPKNFLGDVEQHHKWFMEAAERAGQVGETAVMPRAWGVSRMGDNETESAARGSKENPNG